MQRYVPLRDLEMDELLFATIDSRSIT
jgi:hypothetical protein